MKDNFFMVYNLCNSKLLLLKKLLSFKLEHVPNYVNNREINMTMIMDNVIEGLLLKKGIIY